MIQLQPDQQAQDGGVRGIKPEHHGDLADRTLQGAGTDAAHRADPGGQSFPDLFPALVADRPRGALATTAARDLIEERLFFRFRISGQIDADVLGIEPQIALQPPIAAHHTAGRSDQMMKILDCQPLFVPLAHCPERLTVGAT